MTSGFQTMGDLATTPALELAQWICASTPSRPDALTHLKLQKLAFYCYGALLAFDFEHEVGEITFEAWKHGPVSPEMYRAYSGFGREPLPQPAHKPKSFSPRAEAAMGAILNVYGRLTAWQLREESHCEKPWEQTFDGSRAPISTAELRSHFSKKFCGPVVSFPERLFGASSLELDRIPVPSFSSLAKMSEAATRILG